MATLFRDHEYGALALSLAEGHVVLWNHNLVREDAQAVQQILKRYASLEEDGGSTQRWRVSRNVHAARVVPAVVSEMRSRGYADDPLAERAITEATVEEAQAPDLPNARTALVHDAVEEGVRQHLGIAIASLREHTACSAASLSFLERPNASRVGVQRPPFVRARLFTGDMIEGEVKRIILEALKPLTGSVVRLTVTEAYGQGNAVEIGLAIAPIIMESYLDRRLPVFEHRVTGARDVLFLLESPIPAQALAALTELASLTTAATSVMHEQHHIVVRIPSGYAGNHLADHALRERLEWIGRQLDPWGATLHEVGDLTEVQAIATASPQKQLTELGEALSARDAADPLSECAHHEHPAMQTVAMMMEEDDCAAELMRAGMTEREAALAERAWDYEVQRGGTPSSWMHRVQERTGRSHDDLTNILNEAVDASHSWSMTNNGLVMLKQRLTDPSMKSELEDIRKMVKEGGPSLDAKKLRLARRRLYDMAASILRAGNVKLAEFVSKVEGHLASYMARKGLEESAPANGLVEADSIQLGPLRLKVGDRVKFPGEVGKFAGSTWSVDAFGGPGGNVTFGRVGKRGKEMSILHPGNVVGAPAARLEKMARTGEMVLAEAKVSKAEHAKILARAHAKQGTSGGRPINQSEYPAIRGMEGPFQFKSGHILYYDSSEGAYYDRKSDLYVSLSDIGESVDEAKGGRVVIANLQAARALAQAKGGPFRAPHYTASKDALLQEVGLAQGGVLFLDDLAEFRKLAIERAAYEIRRNQHDVTVVVRPNPKTAGERFTGPRWDTNYAILRKVLSESVDEGINPTTAQLKSLYKKAKAVQPFWADETVNRSVGSANNNTGWHQLQGWERRDLAAELQRVISGKGSYGGLKYSDRSYRGGGVFVSEAETLGNTFVVPSDRTDAIYARPGELSGEDDEEDKNSVMEATLNEDAERRELVAMFHQAIRKVNRALPARDAVLDKLAWRMGKYDGKLRTPHPANIILSELDKWLQQHLFLLKQFPQADKAFRSAMSAADALADMNESVGA